VSTLDVAGAAAAVVAAVVCLRASGRASSRGALAWRFQAAACLVWALGAVLGGADPAPVPAALRTLLDVAAPTLVAAGMWFTSRGADARSRVRMLLDGTTAAVGAATLTYALHLGRLWEVSDQLDVMPLVRPVVPAVLAVFYVCIMLAEIPVQRWPMPLLLSSALAAATGAETARSVRVLSGGGSAGAAPWAWVLCFALVAAAGLVYSGTSVRRHTSPSTWLVSLAPYALVAPAAVVLLATRLRTGGLGGPEEAGAGALVTLVLLRQFVTLAENRDLVARLAASEAELRHRASHDVLTGLPNRALLLERLTAATGPVGVLAIDLDGFKQVNDERGHDAGDQLLVEVARRLRADVADGDTTARLGGDEFAVVVPGPPEAAHAVAARLLASLDEPYTLRDGSCAHVGASIGVASLHDEDRGVACIEEVLRRADSAMYTAKRRGGSQAAGSEPVPAPGRPAGS
jgi:diguanylate cyclase (GGDEF)-like protein